MTKFSQFDIGRMRPKHPRKPDIAPKPRQPKKFMAKLSSFAAAGLVLLLLLQTALYLAAARNASGEILGAATMAYSDLDNAGKNLGSENLADAKLLFESAQSNVKLAQDKLNAFRPLTWIAPQAGSADHILAGASYLSMAGQKLTLALDLFEEFKVSSQGVETMNFTEKLIENKQLLIETRDLVELSGKEFNQAQSVPADYSGTLDKAKEQVRQLGAVLRKLVDLEDLYLSIFSGQKTYLLIFQNYDEVRATGGFIGTYGVMETNQGRISKLNIDSVYDLDGKIYEPIAAPGPFQPDIQRWGIRDANWFADFPQSAKKLLYFFEKAQQTADGVISTTPKVFEDLLKLVGPLEMKEYGVTLTAENFQEVVQYKTSVDYDHEENEPKKLLADFAPMLLDRLTNLPKDQWFGFFQIMQDNLNQRQILVYSQDERVEKTIDNLGFSGKVLSTDHDYLNIVNSNLGGTKTDLEISQTVDLKSKILSDGSIVNTLTIFRKNNALDNNKNYMRILVPMGSQFISAVGFDDRPMYASVAKNLRTDPDLAAWDEGREYSNVFVRTEAGKTEFAGWFSTMPDEERSITVTYMLPFRINADSLGAATSHSLLLQKQAGSIPYEFKGSLSLGRYRTNWLSAGVTSEDSKLNFNSRSNTDDFWGFVISK